MPKLNAHANANAEVSAKVSAKVKVVLLPIAAVALLGLSAAVATAGTVGPAFTPPSDFNMDGSSDVLLHKLAGPNTGINETQIVTGTVLASRGWPDLNVGNDLSVQYITRGYGNFDGNANGQAQILTRKFVGNFLGLVRLVALDATGIARAVPGQFFVGGVGTDYNFLGVGDCNGDGTDDIVYHKISGANIGLIRIQFMDPASPFAVLSTGFPGSLPVDGGGVLLNSPIGVADADGDGQADIWTLDGSNNAVEILINAPGVATGDPFEGSAMPTTVPNGYKVVGIGFFNRADTQADILLENSTGALPNQGVLRIDYTGDGGGATNAPPTTFPALLDVVKGETGVGVGDYDGLNQQDILTRLTTPTVTANTGALVVRLMNADGTDLVGTSGTLAEIEGLEYRIVNGAPVLAP